jgi:hypothetical protein
MKVGGNYGREKEGKEISERFQEERTKATRLV